MNEKAKILLPVIDAIIYEKQMEEMYLEELERESATREENSYFIVTREMAMDAQDMSLEGTRW